MMSYENAARQQLHRRWWLRAVGVMACIVVFITVYALVLPAITMEGNPTCGLAEHEHTEDCYTADGVLICQLEEHTHDAACYAEAEEGELAEPDAEAEDADLVAPPVDVEADPAEETDAAEPEDDLVTLGAMPMARVLAAGPDGSLIDGVTTTGANDWQIVSGGYEGNSVSNKTESDDHHVRVQKNVIPTDTENEFLVYLSIDINRETVLKEIFEAVGLVVTPSNDAKTPGTVLTGSSEDKANNAWNTGADDGNMRVLKQESSPGYTNRWTITFVTDDGPVTIVRYASGNSYSNGHFVMRINGTWLVVGDAAKGAGSSNVEITLSGEILKEILELATSVDTGSVTDTMGTNIVATEIVGATGSASISSDGKTINWTPNASTGGDTEDGWYENIGELLYKITYTPEVSTGLVSGGNDVADNADAVVNTNGSAVLNYRVNDESAGSTTDAQMPFPNPEIRGMLYEVKALKVTDKGDPLPGASFGIYSDAECNNQVGTASISDDDGVIDFSGLQYGTYYIKELSAPKGYEYSDEVKSVRLCYTDTKAVLIGQGAGEEALYDGTAAANLLSFTNKFNQPTIVLMKCDEDGDPLKDASFTITSTGGLSIDATSVASGKITTIENAENGTYTVTETQAPDGYNLLSDALTIEVNGADDVTAKLGSARLDEPTITKTVDQDGITIYTILIYNNSGAVLPATGGPGTVIFTVSGLALMAAAMILLNKQRKRNHA